MFILECVHEHSQVLQCQGELEEQWRKNKKKYGYIGDLKKSNDCKKLPDVFTIINNSYGNYLL